MKLKISGNTEERFDRNLTSFLNLATLICLKGIIPTQKEIDEPERLGKWWFLDEGKRYVMIGAANDYWANIREKGENYIVIEFSFRYDIDLKKKKAVSNLMLALFDFVECLD